MLFHDEMNICFRVPVSKVQAVVYMTRSVNDSENENVVSKAVEQTNMIQQRKFPWRVVPPVLPFSGQDIEKGVGICGKFIKFQPSEKNSGCFVAVVTREVCALCLIMIIILDFFYLGKYLT